MILNSKKKGKWWKKETKRSLRRVDDVNIFVHSGINGRKDSRQTDVVKCLLGILGFSTVKL